MIVIVLVILYCFETTQFCSFSLIFGKFQIVMASFGVFIVKLDHISHLFLMFTVDFEQVDAW